MRQVFKLKLSIIMALLLVSGFAFAGTGPGDGTGPIHSIIDGTPFTFTGVVVSLNGKGSGLTLVDAEGVNYVVFGLGPVWFWDAAGVERPEVNDEITVTGYTVDCNGVARNIATSLTYGTDPTDPDIVLRDETGAPLWKKAQRQIRREQKRTRTAWAEQ